MNEKFGEFWQIWRMVLKLPNFSSPISISINCEITEDLPGDSPNFPHHLLLK